MACHEGRWASDRSGNRLAFVALASLAMAAACRLMLISQALGFQRLPDPRHTGRDQSVFNRANTAPMVLAPALAWLCLVHLGGYTTLLGVASLLIAAPLWRLRGAR